MPSRSKQSKAEKKSAKNSSRKKPASAARAKKQSASSEHPDKPIRLQRLLASAGFGSRRQCEELITEGRVVVDGQIVDRLGTSVDPATAKVYVDGGSIRKQKLVYYAVNKPVGVVTTNSDPRGRPRVIDLVPPTERVFAVGRLDMTSEGLILLTNDGELAQQLAHPKYQVRKVYRVTVAGKVDPETMRLMRKGMYISEGFVRVEGARMLKARSKSTELEISLREGKNREIRRILARLGHKVQKLRRIAIGPLRLGDTPSGAYRLVTRDEIRRLREEIQRSRNSSPSRARKKRGATNKEATPQRKTRLSAKRNRQQIGKTGSTKDRKPAIKRTGEIVITRSPDQTDASTEDSGAVIGAKSSRSIKKRPKKKSAPRKSVSSKKRQAKKSSSSKVNSRRTQKKRKR